MNNIMAQWKNCKVRDDIAITCICWMTMFEIGQVDDDSEAITRQTNFLVFIQQRHKLHRCERYWDTLHRIYWTTKWEIAHQWALLRRIAI